MWLIEIPTPVHPNAADISAQSHVAGTSPTPSSSNFDWLIQEAQSSSTCCHGSSEIAIDGILQPGQVLLDARAKHARAQQDSQEAFQTYTASLELERQARQEVHAAEQRRDDISKWYVLLNIIKRTLYR
jgi:hypothetical protein